MSDALAGREGYYFRFSAGGDVPEIVRKSGDVGEQLALRPDGLGGYELVEVSGKIVQATTTALPDGVAARAISSWL